MYMPKVVFLIFILALAIRFLYFPNNVNFSYDQARDSFAVLDILKGDFKVLGPPTTAGGNIFHGVLFYYLLAPIYFFSNYNPEVAAAIFRVINALGVFLVFYIGSIIFRKEVGLLTAFLFAINYEQSQYSLFFGHPTLGVISVLILYTGLSLWIFKDKGLGFVVALLGLGLAFQFEDANFTLGLVFMIFLTLFYKRLKSLNFSYFFAGFFTFLLIISTFIVSEIKYNFRMSEALLQVSKSNHVFNIQNIFQLVPPIYFTFFMISFAWLIWRKPTRQKGLFLLVWFMGGMITQILNPSFTYYYSPGATVSLLILSSFVIYQLFSRNKFFAVFLLMGLIFNNLFLITNQNYKGPNKDVIIQPGLLTSNERKTLDYVYGKSDGQPFAINALTVPLNVKTTWDFLFNWYGYQKYGYLPIWGGEVADGFPGTLTVITDRSKLPSRRFTVFEPTVGIGQSQIDDFLRIENYFSKVVDERTFGTIKVQSRERI